MEGGTTLGAKEGGRVERRPRRPLAEATSRTDQQRAAGRGLMDYNSCMKGAM